MRCRGVPFPGGDEDGGFGENPAWGLGNTAPALLLDVLGNGQERGLREEEELGLLREARSAASSGTTSVTC